MAGLEPLEAGQAVHARHADVEQDHRRIELLGQLQARFAPVALANYFDPVRSGKHRPQASPRHLVIVDEQYTRWLVHALPSPFDPDEGSLPAEA